MLAEVTPDDRRTTPADREQAVESAEPAAAGSAPLPSIAGGATLSAGGQVAGAVAGATMGIVVARVLGPAGTGSFNVVLAALLVMFSFSTLGVPTGLTYYVSNGQLRAGDAFRHALVGASVLGLAGFLFALGVAALGDSGPFQRIPLGTVALGMAALPFNVIWVTCAGLAVAIERYTLAAAVPALQALAALVGVAVLVPFLGLAGAVGAVAGSHLLVAGALTVWAVRRLPATPGWLGQSGTALRKANAFGWKVYVTAGLNMLIQRADLFILNAFVASASVGHYAIAVAATLTGTLVPRGLALVVFPRVTRLDAVGPAIRRPTIVKSVRHAVLVAVMTAVLMAPALLLIPFVYGRDFSPAVELGLILVPGVSALSVQSVLAAVVIGLGRPRDQLTVALLVAPPTLVAYVLLIPELGASGAALASTLSYVASAVLTLHYVRRATPLPTLRGLLPTRAELADYRMVLRRIRERIGERP